MAEGGAEEENGEMLGPAAAPSHQPPTGLNVKTEVSPRNVTQNNYLCRKICLML